jgi:hypothetical protein
MTTISPYYDEVGVTIYHADCREILPSLGMFDLLLTDPPYGIGIGTKARHRFESDASRRWRGVEHAPVHGDDEPFDPRPVLTAAPRAILWGANHYARDLPISPCWLAWDRKCGRAADSNIGEVELAIVIGHRYRTVRIYRHMWAGRDSEVGERVLHPTQKPVDLMRWCLSFFPEARTVIDPYMGSGPVARACKDSGRRYVGIEIVERYCEIAATRLQQEVLFT